MANIRARRNKDGEITSYQIRVFKGRAPDGTELKPYTATFKPDPTKTQRQNEKALNAFAVDFENKCKLGLIADSRQTFADYAEYVMQLKKRQGAKQRTLDRYGDLLVTINKFIGFMKLADIRPQHLNKMYESLLKCGTRNQEPTATFKGDFKQYLKEKGMTQAALARKADVPPTTLTAAAKGHSLKLSAADKVSRALGKDTKKLFTVKVDNRPLSAKTVLEYHHLCSTILQQADKELLIPYNPARKATPPKVQRKEPNYFQVEDVERIRDALENVPLKWKTITHLLLITGCRRGEVAGLSWNAIDWSKNRIHICRTILYSSKIGVYEDTPKTTESDRYITLPPETMKLLREYREWYFERAAMYGDRWHNTGFLFFQEKTGSEGKPMNPDTITSYLDEFSKKYDLPHINPHAFRHTQASILYFNGIDSVSISKRLGHSKVSTTSDIYAHIIKEADERASECIADVILRPKVIPIDEHKKAE